jgi:TonB family protein
MSDSWKDCEGQIIDGEFTLLEHLGGSDHSVVFLTQRGKNKSEQAGIKFVQADTANAEIQLSRWKQAADISHPNLIRLFESGRCHLAGMDLLYVVMEYAPENLAQFLPERALSPAETRDMLEPFVETLTHLHGKGFIHGRIKPGNILAIDDQLKLSSDSVSRIGEPQILLGKTDAYTAPEGVAAGSPAGDVWSLGVTLIETLTQHLPEQKDQEELKVSDSVPQPFLDIARHSLRRDPQSRWTVAEISARLNPPAPKVSAPAIPDPIKPVAVKPSRIASVAAESETLGITKPAASVDPLSVPLSTISPLHPSRQHVLESQSVAGKGASYRSYYVVVAVLVALTLGAMLAIPRLRDHQSEPEMASAPSQPAAQPESPRTPATSQPEPKSPQKKTTPASDRALQGLPQRSALQPSQGSSQDSLKTASDKQLFKKDAASDSGAGSTAATSSTAVHSDPISIDPPRATGGALAGTVTQGEVLNQVLPEVSAKSRSTIHGTVRVIVKVHVDASGTVTGAEPAASPSKFFGDAAVQAAKHWDFAPAKVADQRVPSEWLVRFDFTQTDTKVLPSQTKP